MFNIGDNVMLKIKLADAIQIDPWIKAAEIKEHLGYLVQEIMPPMRANPIKINGFWLNGDCFTYYKHPKSVGFVIE